MAEPNDQNEGRESGSDEDKLVQTVQTTLDAISARTDDSPVQTEKEPASPSEKAPQREPEETGSEGFDPQLKTLARRTGLPDRVIDSFESQEELTAYLRGIIGQAEDQKAEEPAEEPRKGLELPEIEGLEDVPEPVVEVLKSYRDALLALDKQNAELLQREESLTKQYQEDANRRVVDWFNGRIEGLSESDRALLVDNRANAERRMRMAAFIDRMDGAISGGRDVLFDEAVKYVLAQEAQSRTESRIRSDLKKRESAVVPRSENRNGVASRTGNDLVDLVESKMAEIRSR